MPLSDLRTVPEPVTQTAEVLVGLDEAFVSGFGRLASAHLETLATLQRSFYGTPIGEALATAVAGLGRSEFIDRHFAVLAVARAAAHGAMHDALQAQACAALGRPRPVREDIPAAATQAPPPKVAVLLESTRQWLMELAIAGFANLDVGSLLPFQTTLDAILGEPSLVRLAALLTGFLDELLATFPAHGTPEIPRQRWVDLWARSMVLALAPTPAPATRPASGLLAILATDLRQHSNVVSLVAHGVLREASGPRLVRTSIAAFKVDVLEGEDVAARLATLGDKLITALAGGQALKIDGMPLTAAGDLVWQDARASLDAKIKPIEVAASVLATPPANRPGFDPDARHPALLEELVYLAGNDCAVVKEDGKPVFAAAKLPVDLHRWPDSDDLSPDDLAGCKALVALLRFDAGRWSLQPVAIDKGKPLPRMVGTGLSEARKKAKGGNLSVLQERASRLLRQKS
jgi:hypothetical protein